MKRILMLMCATLLFPLAAHAAETVTVKGSDTMVVLAQRWAEEYMKKNPEVKLQVTGGGSGTGIAALINGSTEIAMASRAMKPAEKDKLQERTHAPPVEMAMAKDGVTFYVHAKNPVSALSLEQLRAIFAGDTTDWNAVGGKAGPIVLYSRESSSGTYVFVKEEVLKNDDFAAKAQTLPGTAAVVNAVAKEPRGIGYGGAAYASGVKELKIKVGQEEIAPSSENVRAGKYPLSRDLFFYTASKPTGAVKAFIDFCLSPAGQAVVTQVGYFPIVSSK